MVDRFGTPRTSALYVVERYRLLDCDAAKEGMERDAHENQIAMGTRDETVRDKYLQLQFTVEDEGVFTMPWSATITYGRPRHISVWYDRALIAGQPYRDVLRQRIETVKAVVVLRRKTRSRRNG
jgi:hypothetical protein